MNMNMMNLFGNANQKPPRKSDTCEKIRVNGLSLLKMLKHGKQGIPLEVIGIMLGQRIDEFTIEIIDVFATPQVATGQNVETTDEQFQLNYMKLLERTGYDGHVQVGWYHSHPGFDVWLSDVDVKNQQAMEAVDERAVAVVVDPVLSARGHVVIGAFRNIPMGMESMLSVMSGKPEKSKKGDPREKTSFIGHTIKPSPKTAHLGLNRSFYMMPIEFRMNEKEQHMLSSLHRPVWSTGCEIPSFTKSDSNNLEMLKNLTQCAKNYRRAILEEANVKTNDELELMHVGKIDPRLYFKEGSDKLASSQAALLARLHVTKAAF
ncbi:26S proteasome non-ATPase regulatory subunit 14 [Tritrichomonas foetus]|uniref:26S proteasome non-ATPase regulatory subunit 14 n=1 Tax=Tritrichomonas foetus TaxID=1144522 RepID=A0A1J4JIZ7_9EUKA|nr:26S proteasome non-ATPase regulatory subunit 14 [Tritrichomonas foetus]|eukprot:OHS97525.1 26S proteasome non-ATPase regulatory subunit 14 [Tritrichomonas foetus]